MITKYCERKECGKPIQKNRFDSRKKYLLRRFCSMSCNGKYGATLRGNKFNAGPRVYVRPKPVACMVQRFSLREMEYPTRGFIEL